MFAHTMIAISTSLLLLQALPQRDVDCTNPKITQTQGYMEMKNDQYKSFLGVEINHKNIELGSSIKDLLKAGVKPKAHTANKVITNKKKMDTNTITTSQFTNGITVVSINDTEEPIYWENSKIIMMSCDEYNESKMSLKNHYSANEVINILGSPDITHENGNVKTMTWENEDTEILIEMTDESMTRFSFLDLNKFL